MGGSFDSTTWYGTFVVGSNSLSSQNLLYVTQGTLLAYRDRVLLSCLKVSCKTFEHNRQIIDISIPRVKRNIFGTMNVAQQDFGPDGRKELIKQVRNSLALFKKLILS